jgi:hypothetical protein
MYDPVLSRLERQVASDSLGIHMLENDMVGTNSLNFYHIGLPNASFTSN